MDDCPAKKLGGYCIWTVIRLLAQKLSHDIGTQAHILSPHRLSPNFEDSHLFWWRWHTHHLLRQSHPSRHFVRLSRSWCFEKPRKVGDGLLAQPRSWKVNYLLGKKFSFQSLDLQVLNCAPCTNLQTEFPYLISHGPHQTPCCQLQTFLNRCVGDHSLLARPSNWGGYSFANVQTLISWQEEDVFQLTITQHLLSTDIGRSCTNWHTIFGSPRHTSSRLNVLTEPKISRVVRKFLSTFYCQRISSFGV